MLFSVLMCVYGKDNPHWFRQAVDSILNQTVKPAEVVLVVDGPIPDELEYVVAYYKKMPEFRVIRLSKNVGLGNARRIGLENCQYPLVAFMDADDISVFDRFERQINMFAQIEKLDIVGGDILEFIDTTEQIIAKREVPSSDIEIKKYLKKRCPMNHVTVMCKKESVQKAGGYLDWYCNEDYYLWIRLLLNGATFANVPECLVKVRVGRDMYRRRGGWKYFCSEARLQNYMLSKRIIGPLLWTENVLKRLIVQVLLPNRIRGWVFQKFARKSVN